MTTTNLYDGSDEPLSYGQALVLLASRPGVFSNEEQQTAIVRAIQAEHGLTPPEPDALVNPADSRDVTLRQQDEELERLRAELARRDKAKNESAAKADEIAAIKAQLAGEVTDGPSAMSPEVAPRDAELAAKTV